MRQPTAKELKKGRAGKTKFMRSPRYLTKGDKPGEMVYSKPNTSIYDEEVYNSLSNSMSNPANTAIPQQGTGRYVMSGPNKGTRRVTQVKSDVTGGRGKTNPPKVKGIKTVALKKNNSISKAMGEDYTKMPKKAAKKLPKKKKMRQPTSNKELTEGYAGRNIVTGQNRYLIPGNKSGEMVLTRSMTQPDADGSVYKKTPKGSVRKQVQIKSDVKGGRGKTNPSKVKTKTTADYTKGLPDREMEIKMGILNQSGMDTASTDAEGPKKKKMGGGKVYERKHGGKVIKNNMSGRDLVKACYDN